MTNKIIKICDYCSQESYKTALDKCPKCKKGLLWPAQDYKLLGEMV